MKKALLLLFFFSVGQIFFPCRAEIYSFVKGKIQRNDTSYVVTHHEWQDEKVKPYSDVATLSFKANSETYELKLQNYKGWEGEGGDFRVIKLYHKGNLILEFVDEEAWIGEKVRDRGGVTPFSEFSEEVGKHATYNEYCLIYPLENNATALLFEGYSWSSQVPLLTIIVIKDNKAEVVFNQPWSVEFFNAKPKGFELVLIANFLQWGKGPEYDIWGSDRHKLYTNPEGTMKFEKLSEEEEMCSLDFLTKGTWEFRFSTEEGPFNRDESSRIEATYSTTTQTSILKSPERGEIVHHARYYLSKTLQSSFDESKVGKSLRGNYICVEDTANNGVNNYEIKGYTSDILTTKLVDDKHPTYTNTFFRITENPHSAQEEEVLESTLTKLTNKVWDFLYFDGDDDEEDVRVEFSYSTTEASVHVISNVWDTTEVSKFYLSDSIVNVFDDSKIGKINNGKYIILKDVFEDGHTEVTCEEILELTDTTLTIRDIEEGDYSFPTTLYRK